MAKWLSSIGAVACGLLILAIMATTVWAFTIRPGGPGGAMGLGMAFIVLFPLALIPVGLFCLVGAVLSGVALRRHSTPAARIGLWLALGGPLAVIACYGACFGILIAAFG